MEYISSCRYTTGLEKLGNAAGQVANMQTMLFNLQPELLNLSDETEKIMVTIERETAEAEKKKEVIELSISLDIGYLICL